MTLGRMFGSGSLALGLVVGSLLGSPWASLAAQDEPQTNSSAGEQDSDDTPVQEGQADVVAPDVPAEDDPPRGPSYRFLPDRSQLLAAWLASGIAEPLDLAQSVGGRALFCVQFGGPGPTALIERPTILLLGALDGRSIAGSEAVISITDQLLANPGELPSDVTFISVPWANPDGLARWIETGCSQGRNDRATDDDGDGRVDEDFPDDLDGDGLILEMLIQDASGPWVRTEGGRFLRRAREGEAPRFIRSREGRDDDSDGFFNEDPIGGVALDRNFPIHWAGPWERAHSGAWPLSEPVSRALADLVLARRTAAVLVYQGHHGRLVMPGGVPADQGGIGLPLPADLPIYRSLAESFALATGREQLEPIRLHAAYQDQLRGTAVDWCYLAAGALAMEVGVWGPAVDREASEVPYSSEGAAEAPFRTGDAEREVRESSLRRFARPRLDPLVQEDDLERAFGAWIDERRGGIGFVPWQPIDLGKGREVLLGGWKQYTCYNPPIELLPSVLQGQAEFVLGIGHGLPRLEIEVQEIQLRGRVALVRARVRNAGLLPTGVGPESPRLTTKLRILMPEGMQLLAGEREVDLGHLPAHGESASFEWLLVAAEDSVVRLEVQSDWTPPTNVEVRFDR